MGSWNETCVLSHLQILVNDSVKLIILVRNAKVGNKSHHCYYNEEYAPLTLPIDTVYDDYGGVKKINNMSSYTEALLKKLTFVHEDDTVYQYQDISELIDEITECNGLYLKEEYSTEKKKLECVFVHSKLYDILVEDFKKRKPYQKSQNIGELWQSRHNDVKQLIREKNSLTAELEKTYKTTDKTDLDLLMKEMRLEDDIRKRLLKTAQYGYSFPEQYVLNNTMTEETMNDFFEEMTDYVMWAMSLSFGRYGYLTRCGAGGQDRDVRVQNLVAQFVLDFSKRVDEDDEDCPVYAEDETIFWYEPV